LNFQSAQRAIGDKKLRWLALSQTQRHKLNVTNSNWASQKACENKPMQRLFHAMAPTFGPAG